MVALALATAPGAGAAAPTAGADLAVSDDLLDDGVEVDAEVNGSADDGSVDADVEADEDGVEADGDVDGDVAGADADATVSTEEVAVESSIEGDAGELNASANASLATGADGTSDDGADAGEPATAGDDDAADRERGPGGLPVPDDPREGAAVGSLLVGTGLLGRRLAAGGVAAPTGGAASLGSGALAWLRAWGWRLLAAAGYQRWDDSDPLEHETRAAIHERLEDEPGTSPTELAEVTGVPLSTVRYHLRILAFEDLVTSVEVRGKRRYFPADVDPDALAPALADEATAAVLEALAREPDSVSGLAERLDRDPSTVSHHLQRLDDEGLVERERDGRRVVNRLADGLADEVAAAAGARAASSAD